MTYGGIAKQERAELKDSQPMHFAKKENTSCVAKQPCDQENVMDLRRNQAFFQTACGKQTWAG